MDWGSSEEVVDEKDLEVIDAAIATAQSAYRAASEDRQQHDQLHRQQHGQEGDQQQAGPAAVAEHTTRNRRLRAISQQPGWVPDLEDFGLALDRMATFRRGRALSVTDVTDALWCEQQAAYKLRLPRVRCDAARWATLCCACGPGG